jgi:hypothetical protein
VGRTVSFDFNQAATRLFAISFDPYHCVERRWGATSEEELASCKDDEIKTRWYNAQQNLRNQAERIYAARARFTVSELENGAAGSGPKKPPRTDLSQLIANIGRGQQMAAMEPVGF